MNLGPVPARWAALQQTLMDANRALQKATAGDKGGYVEKARSSMGKALAALTECLAVAQAEPDHAPNQAQVPPDLVALQDQLNARLTKDQSYLSSASNIKRAFNQMLAAATELAQLPAGDEGGARPRLVGSLEQAFADLGTAVDFAQGRLPLPPSVPVAVLGPNGSVTDMVILSAIFGVGTRFQDVTARVAEIAQPQADPVVVSNLTLKANPAAYLIKNVVINYTFRGEKNIISIREGDILSYQRLVKNATNPPH
jgi:hypothetical protein